MLTKGKGVDVRCEEGGEKCEEKRERRKGCKWDGLIAR